jgi:hemolysin III
MIRFLLPSGWDWMLPVLWGLALLCAWEKLRGSRVNSISVVSYVLLGWFPILAARPLLSAMPAGCLALVVAAGAGYMLGVLFLVWDERCRYFHAVWHLFVIAASACNFAGIAIYVI